MPGIQNETINCIVTITAKSHCVFSSDWHYIYNNTSSGSPL
jgi:hypothetical protein